MNSPFPGMDPFVENQEWEDFHFTFNMAMREQLMPRVEPKYVVRVEKRVYVEHVDESQPSFLRPDLAILAGREGEPDLESGEFTRATPVECLVAIPEEHEETLLVIKDRETMIVVTVIETLSPANKRPGGDGQREYLAKRDLVFRSPSHLVELDLLRGGQRLPMISPYPPGDYYAIVSRFNRRPKVVVFHWILRDPMPSIPIPLLGKEETTLNLQEAFQATYDRARYDLTIDYSAQLVPPTTANNMEWVNSMTSRFVRQRDHP